MTSYYVIAKLDLRSNAAPHDSAWPKFIGCSVSDRILFLSEGCGHGLSGGLVPFEDFDEAEWGSFFNEARADWFLHFLGRNKNFSASELEDEIKKHGKISIENR